MKIYKKQGKPNFKEKKLVDALKDYFEKNPEKYNDYAQPRNYDELKSTHDHYCVETVEFTETKNDGTTTHVKPDADEPETVGDMHKSFRDSLEPEPDLFSAKEDPMNRESPKIRDYVLDDGFQDNVGKEQPRASTYDEPKSFRESFEIPDDNIQGDTKKQQQQQGPLNSPPPPKRDNTPDPDAKIKRKSKKRFTKYAVDAVCALMGRGIVWWTTKDITNEKLQEYIINDEISKSSLDLLVYLDSSTQGSVKQFFEIQIVKAQDLAHFTVEEKEDLAEALEDFLEYKKIEINPTINFGVILLGMAFDRVMKAMQNRAETSSILAQLRNMHQSTEDTTHYTPPPAPEQRAETEATQEEDAAVGEITDIATTETE